MYRNEGVYIKEWFYKKVRKPLVIRGARQVGKSTLVRQFCQQNHLKLLEINLEKYPELEDVFATNKINQIIDALEDILEVKFSESSTKSLLFLDEIQAVPSCLSSLRYFYEELPAMPVIGAGSLLEFILNDHEYAMPVGRIEFLHMGPMSFREFLMAKKENFFLDKISKMSSPVNISDSLHQKGLDLLREYFFIGGMPEAIKTFVESGIDEVAPIHAQILQAYQADFVRYAKKSHLQKIQKVFRYVFQHPCEKIKYSNISREDSARDLKHNLQLLRQAKVLTPVYHSACAGLPLEASESENIFKILTLDIGLMNHSAGIEWKTFKKYGENEIIIEGKIAEQFIGQHLLYRKKPYLEPKLQYWLREGKRSNAEVDFVVEEDGYFIAIEVKAGAAGKIRSLHQWMADIKYAKKKAIRFNLSKGSIEKVSHKLESKRIEYELVTLPLYLGVEHIFSKR